MSVQTLLISLAVTCVAVGITFLYFRNRMNKTEQKVDLMFQLIQEHEKNSRMANQMQMHQLHQANATAQFQNNETELINISDNENENEESEEEYDSDDSAEISDDEEDKLVIQNDADGNVENTVKMISLTLDGAETSVAELTSENLMETLEVNSLSVNHDGESVPSIDELDEVQLSDNDDLDGSQHADQESNGSKSDDGTLNNFVVTKKTSTSQQETSSSDEDNTSEVEKEDAVANTNYEKLTKAQLKKLAEDKGLAGYKKLTKTGLVDLLNQNQ